MDKRKLTGLSLYTNQERIIEVIKQNMLISSGKLKDKLRFNHAFIDLEGKCNLACEGCFKGRDKVDPKEKVEKLTLKEMRMVVDFAKSRGAKVIVFAGEGETTMDSDFQKIIRYIDNCNLYSVVFTNGTFIDKGFAHFLFNHRVSPILKRYAMDELLQDRLLGTPGGSKLMKKGLGALLRVKKEREAKGLATSDVAIDCYIVKKNLKQIPDILRWCRKKGLIPYFESYILSEDPADNQKFSPSQEQLNNLFEQLASIDLKEFGIATILWPGARIYGQEGPCLKPRSGFAVKTNGKITECVSGGYFLGNIRKTSLEKIFDLDRPRVKKLYSSPICPAPRCSLNYTGYRRLRY